MRRRLWTGSAAPIAIRTLIPFANLLFAADGELASLLDGGPLAAILVLQEVGIEAVVRNRGTAGAEIHHRDGSVMRAAPLAAVPVRDTVGAG